MKTKFTGHSYLIFFYHLLLSWLMFNIGRLVFYIHNLSSYEHLSAGEIWTAWLGGQRFDIAAMGYINSLYMFAFIVLGYFPGRVRESKISYHLVKWLFLIPNIAAVILNVGDAGYFPFVRKRMTSTVFQEFGGDNPFFLVLRLAWQNPLLTSVAIAMIALLIWAYGRIKYRSTTNTSALWRFIITTGKALAVAFVTVVGIRGGLVHSIRPLSPFNAHSYVKEVKDRDLVLNTPFCMIRTADKKVLKLIDYIPREEAETLFSATYKAAPLGEQDSLFGSYKDYNVMILILESFAKEHIGALQPDGKGFSPFLDGVIRDSATLSFPYAFANGVKSIDAMPSIVASIPALGLNFVTSNYSGNEIDGMGSCLMRHGYKEAVFMHGAPNGSMGFDAFSTHMGYTGYHGMKEYNNDADYDNAWGIWDKKFLPTLPPVVTGQSSPWLTTIFTLSSHHPFKLPKEEKGKYPEGKVDLQRMIGYSDDALRLFFEKASSEPWFDKTIFIITADHTSQSANPAYANVAGRFAIPLLWYIPGKPLPRDIYTNKVVQQADIYPSLLYLLGIEDEIVSYGHNLFDPHSSSYAVVFGGEYNLISKDGVFALNEQTGERKRLDLDSDLLPKRDTIQSHVITDKMLPAVVMDYNRRLVENRLSAKKIKDNTTK